jgi:hypothetical protein
LLNNVLCIDYSKYAVATASVHIYIKFYTPINEMDDNIPASSSPPLPTEANSKASNHVAVSVPDLDKALKWYHEVLGFIRLLVNMII